MFTVKTVIFILSIIFGPVSFILSMYSIWKVPPEIHHCVRIPPWRTYTNIIAIVIFLVMLIDFIL